MSTAEPEANESFIAEFLDDYFAESEEHLILLRRDLLALEGFVDQPQISRSLLDGLFRSFHSLKGISGMVGVRAAEQLAHQMESYLRALRQDEVTLTAVGMDGLIAGTKMLEQVISARRQQSSPPDISSVIAHLEGLLVQHASTEEREKPEIRKNPKGRQAPHAELIVANDGVIAGDEKTRLWRFEFTPLPELAERGININLVRDRLQTVGELRNGVPRVIPGGGITFEFLVASQETESAFAPLRDLGLTYEQLPEPPSETPAQTVLPQIIEETPREVAVETDDGAAAPLVAPASVVRVGLGRLDELMRMIGDLSISRAQLDENLKQAETDMPVSQWRALQETNQLIERQLRDLREGVMRVRMVPIGEIFERMRFVVRDLARDQQKTIRLEVSGQETEIDKLLIERMMDPLMHLVRNAVSHGLESASERERLGKPREGTISLRASTSAEVVIIEVEDDGRGLARERVAERARAIGLLFDDTHLDNAALLDLICAPGFSTREEADRASGRGVGMAVVQDTVRSLGGAVSLETEVGRGTRFTIQLPITLLITDALIVFAGGQDFAVPQSSVHEVIELDTAAVKAFENNEILSYRDGILPLVRLARVFGLPESENRVFHAFVVGAGLNAVGVVVDRILGQREIVVRAINDPLLQVAGIAGATELGNGRVVLILDAAAFGKRSIGKQQSSDS